MPERVDSDVLSDCVVPVGESVCESAWEYGEFPVIEATVECAPSHGKVKISPLQLVDVVVNGKAVRALNDSGAQIPLISQNLSQEIPTELRGKIVIDGVVGSALVPLTNVGVQLAAEPGTVNVSTAELPVVCGIVELCRKEYDMILPAEVAAELQQIPAVPVAIAECVSADDDVIADVLSEQVPSECDVTSSPMSDADVTNVESVNHSSQSGETMEDDSSRLMHEQQQDETMSDCWSMARLSKGNPVISRGLLYRKDEVEGQPTCRMCVPVARHDVILKPVDYSGPLEPPSAQGHNYCSHSCVLLLCFVIWCLCVMTECIVEFGMMLLYDIVADESVMPSVRVESEQVQQRDEIADCFSVKPGLCDVVAHRIVTTLGVRSQADEAVPRARRFPDGGQSADPRTAGQEPHTSVHPRLCSEKRQTVALDARCPRV